MAQKINGAYLYWKKKLKLYHFLYLLVILEFVWIISYYFSPVGMASLDSDLTTGVQFLEQVLKEKKLYPQNWIYTNTISFPLTMPAMIVIYKITGDYMITILLNYVLYTFFMAASIHFFARKVLQMKKSFTVVTILILLSPGSAVYFRSVFFTGYAFRIAEFLLLLGFGLLSMRDSRLNLNIKYLCLYLLSVFLSAMGDIRYLATLILPLFIAAALGYFADHYENNIRSVLLPLKNYIFYVLTVSGSVFACILTEQILKNKFVFEEGFFDASLVTDLADIWENLKGMMQEYINACGFVIGASQMSYEAVFSLCGLIFGTYILIANPIIMLVHYKKFPFAIKQLIIYRWTGYTVTMFFWIFTSGISFRHALTLFALDIILAVFYFARMTLSDGKVIKLFGCVVLMFYMAFNWCHNMHVNISSQWNCADAISVLEDRNRVIKVLKDRELFYGYAPFWTASITSAFSQEEIKIYPWELYDRYKWYAPNDLYLPAEQNEPTFLLLMEDEYKQYAKKKDFRKLWGDFREKIDESGYVLLIYDYNIAVNFKEFSCLSDQLLKHMTIPKGNYYKISDHPAVYLEQGNYMFGPYIDLPGGAYTLHVTASGSAVLNINFTKDGQDVISNICQVKLKKGINKVSFILLENTENVEFYIKNDDQKEIMVSDLSLKTGSQCGMLNQMKVSKENEKNGPDAVYLECDEVLFGPYLEAKQGEYMLTVTADHSAELHIWTNKSENIIIQKQLHKGKNQIPFTLTENVTDLEFVIRNTNSKELKITNLQVEKSDLQKEKG